ncbi:MAG: META domain-containing protein [Lamprobacter sp.]|uniref:META domain-containing protein n=1 Tax=Lamprobacter sp. TaxID=3100796 RepID=UPI002B25BCBE|nr:META domain-containing protein [Lamprobacter sp.]MEA3641321.1 META domain-containing protein [Lamprobacter sp.]
MTVVLRALSLVYLLVGANGLAVAEADTRTISGQLAYLQRVALTPDSIAVVEFRADNGQLQGETRFASEGRQVPLPFALQVPNGTKGEIRGAIWSAGRPAWVSDPVAIAAGDEPLEIGTVRLQPPSPTGFRTLMRCGETEIEIESLDDHLRLHVDGKTLDLFPTPAASGAKFTAKDDPETFFWSKGNSALVSLDGDNLPECLAAVPVEKAPFRARGNEPGWNLAMRGEQLDLSLDYGTREIKTQLPEPVETNATRVYSLPEQNLSIRISEHTCSDTMTGMPYPSTVELEIEDQRLTGCGGEPRALLEGPEWTVSSLDGEPVPDEVSVTINFLDDNRVAGSSGCNRFMGGYTLTGEGLSFGQIAGTMMACPDLQMQTEQRFLGLLQAVNRFEATPDGGLQLITTDNKRISAER